MSKKYRYTFISLMLAAAFIFANMAGMGFIMQITEKRLLNEKGTARIQSPVKEWQETSDSNFVLTDEQMQNAIRSLNNNKEKTVHEPVEGQISMEEAIEYTRKWFGEMELGEMNYSISATLCVGNQKELSEIQLEPYYSFWLIGLFSDEENINVYVNAVTGQVFSAGMNLSENAQNTIPYEKLELFAAAAGLKKKNGSETEIDYQQMKAYLAIENTSIYAQMTCINRNSDSALYDYNTEATYYGNGMAIQYDLCTENTLKD